MTAQTVEKIEQTINSVTKHIPYRIRKWISERGPFGQKSESP